MQRITSSGTPAYRKAVLEKQGGKCALCKEKPAVPCLDHCHSTGVNRGVLCRGCNALLGKIENNAKRNGLGDLTKLARFMQNIPAYIVAGQRGGLGTMHHTYKTDEEKRLKRNAAARKARAKKKEASNA